MIHRTLRATLALTFALALLASPFGSALAQDIPGAAGSPSPEPAPAAMPPSGRAGPGGPPPAPAAKPAPSKKAIAGKGIHLAPVTPLAKSVNVHDKVLDQCGIQSLLPQSIAERSSNVTLSTGPSAMKLELTIVDIHAPNGGWFSGPKWITVKGRLLSGKTVKGDFLAKETSMASATACGMLSKVIRVLADDIVIWLNNPTKGAYLGSAR